MDFLNTQVILISIWCAVCTSLPLDDYVKKNDGHYKYTFIKNYTEQDCAVYVLNMTSQKWLTEKTSSRPIWFHHMEIFVPKHVITRDTALYVINGGSNRAAHLPKPREITLSCDIATEAKMLSIKISQIPNEPIRFWDDPSKKSRKEDSIIAWTWKEFIRNTSNPDIILQLPMTKAVVRGMDTVTDFARKIPGGFTNISKFIVTGASKRGWTTWTTAAADKRVIGIAPIVFDLLNIKKSLHHHFRAYGNWSFAFAAYHECNITEKLDSKEFELLASIMDPYSYRDRLTMSKFVVSAAGDEFFLLDDSHYYYDQMKGPTYLRIVPNADHTMFGHYVTVLKSITAFAQALITNFTFPQFSWKTDQTAIGGRITLYSTTKPISVRAHYARTISNRRRDFRLFIANPRHMKTPYPQPIIWFSDSVSHVANGTYIAEYRRPIEGWMAFLIEVKYKGPNGSTLTFTTETNIIPDVFPFPECHGETCTGGLV